MNIPKPRGAVDYAAIAVIAAIVVATLVLWQFVGPSADERREARESAAARASASAASSSTSTPPPTSTSTRASSSSTTSEPTLTANERRAIPGPEVTAIRLTKAPTIDGSGREWGGHKSFTANEVVGGNGKAAVRSSWRLAWDSTNLYVLAAVKDKTITQTHVLRPHLIGTGDSVGFELGTYRDVVRTDALPARDIKVLMGPLEGGGTIEAILKASGEQFVPGPGFSGDVAVRQSRSGYTVEAAIPWSRLGVDSVKAKQRFAANFLVADAVASGSKRGSLGVLQSNNPQRQGSTVKFRFAWGTLTLAP